MAISDVGKIFQEDGLEFLLAVVVIAVEKTEAGASFRLPPSHFGVTVGHSEVVVRSS
jgi:hypothetical protein